jgi:hypothetical protein
VQTVQLGLVEPRRLYDAMLPGRFDGVHALFAWLVIVPFVVGTLLSQVGASDAGEAELMARLYDSLGMMEASNGLRTLIEKSAWLASNRAFFAELVATPVLAFVSLYVMAGGTHLVLVVLGRARHGFAGTLKACVYACVPGFALLVPWCGGLIFMTWATVLQIYGVARAQETTVGWASAAVFGFHAVAICCGCGAPTLAALVAMRWFGGLS